MDIESASRFCRVSIRNTEYYSRMYEHIKIRNSYTVCGYSSGGVYRADGILFCLPDQSLAVIQQLTPTSTCCYLQLLL